MLVHCLRPAMCNLYSVTKPQAAIRDLAKAIVDPSGKPRLPAIFPNGLAPVVFKQPHDADRYLMMMRWGL